MIAGTAIQFRGMLWCMGNLFPPDKLEIFINIRRLAKT